MVGLVTPRRTPLEGCNNQPPVWTNATIGNAKQIKQHNLKIPFINPTGSKAMPRLDFELARTSSDFALNLVGSMGGGLLGRPLLVCETNIFMFLLGSFVRSSSGLHFGVPFGHHFASQSRHWCDCRCSRGSGVPQSRGLV